MLIQDYTKAIFPYEFQYLPPKNLGKRPLFYTDVRRENSKYGFVKVDPGEKFVLSKDEYHRLFMKESGPAYSHEFLKPIGPTPEAIEMAKALDEAKAKVVAAQAAKAVEASEPKKGK